LAGPAYWDSNLFLAYLESTTGQIEAIDALLAKFSRGPDPGIVTSVLSIVEVAFIEDEKQRRRLVPGLDDFLGTIWADPAIRVVDLTTTIAAEARRMLRDSLLVGPRLKPPDAIHLATARSANVGYFFTRDAALIRHTGRYDFAIVEP